MWGCTAIIWRPVLAAHIVRDVTTDQRIRLERQCVEALAGRYYEGLCRGVDQDPALIVAAYRALSAAMAPPPASDSLNRLDLDLLVALLPAAPDQWREFEPALRRAAASADTAAAIMLLSLYRDVSDAPFRAVLAELLRKRLGAAADSLSETEVIAAVRDSLGVTARERQLKDWAELADESETILRQAREESTAPDRVLRQAIHLAGLGTLACAGPGTGRTGPVRSPSGCRSAGPGNHDRGNSVSGGGQTVRHALSRTGRQPARPFHPGAGLLQTTAAARAKSAFAMERGSSDRGHFIDMSQLRPPAHGTYAVLV